VQLQAYGNRRRYGPLAVLRDWLTIDILIQAARVHRVVMVPGHYTSVNRKFASAGTRAIRRVRPRNRLPAFEYETAQLLPRGDDGGFAERFLNDRARRSRHMGDT